MHLIRAALLSISALALLAGCDDRRPPARPEAAPSPDLSGIERDVDGMKTRVALEQANKRIEALERDVAYLKTTPSTIDLTLLTERVQALEVKLVERDAAAPLPPAGGRPLAAAPRSAPKAAATPHAARSGLVLPDLEHR